MRPGRGIAIRPQHLPSPMILGGLDLNSLLFLHMDVVQYVKYYRFGPYEPPVMQLGSDQSMSSSFTLL